MNDIQATRKPNLPATPNGRTRYTTGTTNWHVQRVMRETERSVMEFVNFVKTPTPADRVADANGFCQCPICKGARSGSPFSLGIMGTGEYGPVPTPEPPPELEVTQSTDVVVAWRAWDVRYVGSHNAVSGDGEFSKVLLESTYMNTLWPWGEPLVAHDLIHHGPAMGAKTGIHAYKVREQLPPAVVWGEVSLWGRVVEHALGYRAECAYPRTLWVNPGAFDTVEQAERVAVALRNTYGVEASVAEKGATP